MNKADQAALAAAFRARHKRRPVLLLPNAWDPPSAALFAAAGFEALATTSAGVAWAIGYPDGEVAPWDEVVAATRRIARVTRLPVTADIEAGYGATPEAVAAHVADIIAAGVVGINLEDGLHGKTPIRSIEDAAARIAAARAAADRAGVPIVINARSDLYHLASVRGAGNDPFDETVARCRAYLAAGADCVYTFGVRDPKTIAALTAAIDAPINITGRPGMPDAAALGRLGVARITIAAAPTLVTMSTIRALAETLHASGGFDGLAATMKRPEAQQLFSLDHA